MAILPKCRVEWRYKMGLWAKIRAAIGALRSFLARGTALVGDGLENAMASVWDFLTFRRQQTFEPIENVGFDPDPMEIENDDPRDDAYSILGSEARLAALEMVRTGKVSSTEIRPALRVYIMSLHAGDLAALVSASDLAVGRHIAGVELLNDSVGVPVARPDADGDKERARLRGLEASVKRQAAYAERERRMYRGGPQATPMLGGLPCYLPS